ALVFLRLVNDGKLVPKVDRLRRPTERIVSMVRQRTAAPILGHAERLVRIASMDGIEELAQARHGSAVPEIVLVDAHGVGDTTRGDVMRIERRLDLLLEVRVPARAARVFPLRDAVELANER